MKQTRWTQYSVILLSLLALLALWFPFMSGYSDGELLSGKLVIRGFNLVEFSPLGCIVLLTPLFLIGLQVSTLDCKTKQILLLAQVILHNICLNHAIICGYQWLVERSTRMVTYGYGLPIYIFIILAVQILMFILWLTRLPEGAAASCIQKVYP